MRFVFLFKLVAKYEIDSENCLLTVFSSLCMSKCLILLNLIPLVIISHIFFVLTCHMILKVTCLQYFFALMFCDAASCYGCFVCGEDLWLSWVETGPRENCLHSGPKLEKLIPFWGCILFVIIFHFNRSSIRQRQYPF